MRYASTSIDRRAEYYARCAEVIASDPLDFYTRAEKGRQYLASHTGQSDYPNHGTTPVLAALFGLGNKRNACGRTRRPIDVEKDLFKGILAA
jgi:hypothetical protein